MKNTYYLMRHGWSESNELHVIACSPEGSLEGFGLTDKGRYQAAKAADIFAKVVAQKPIIYSSDFLRARQTAEAVASVCHSKVITDVRLRERNLGELDGASADDYYKVWDAEPDPDAHPLNSESLRQIVGRVMSLIDDCEQNYIERVVLLVSHGDPLVAINSYVMHGDYRPPIHYIGNAEIRRIDEAAPTVSVE